MMLLSTSIVSKVFPTKKFLTKRHGSSPSRENGTQNVGGRDRDTVNLVNSGHLSFFFFNVWRNSGYWHVTAVPPQP